jgi:voltage-gated potassium channel
MPPTGSDERPRGRRGEAGLRARLHTVIFESDTPAGKLFDVALLVAILGSVLAVTLDSMSSFHDEYGELLRTAEWAFTILFTIEFALRLYCVKRPAQYASSFYGIIDLLAILPSYLSLLFAGAQSLMVVRVFRIVRIFRILKLAHYLGEAQQLTVALRASRAKITVFLVVVITVASIVGALMHMIEGDTSGFASIPDGVYWAIVTMTTVGFGDIVPHTAAGRLLASALMLLGYGIIAIPTGIVTSEVIRAGTAARKVSNQACPSCAAEGHDFDAKHCKFCGHAL